MKHAITRALTVALVAAGLAGCQSSPRWAWWKPKDASEDSSVVARSAAPALPSDQSTPQVADAGTLQPAAPPSSANLAAAGTQPAAPATSVPTASPITNAPVATYPTSAVLPNTVAEASPTTTGTTTPAKSIPSYAQIPATASVPSTGPYDPHAYQPGLPVAATPTEIAPPSADRYSAPSADRYASTSATSSPVAATPRADRYAMPAETTAPPGAASSDRYGLSPQSSPVDALPTGVTAASEVAPAPQISTTVQLPAGQYRPGGTSSYNGTAALPVEVASRPSTQTMATPSSQSTPGAEPTSVPWTPPTTGPSTGTRAY